MTAERNSEIRWKDLFAHFLRRWKSILAVTVLCALILGGWQYFSVKKVHDAGEKTKEEARYEEELATYQTNIKNAQDDVEGCIVVWKNRTAYRDHSLLMNLDPENAWAAEKKYVISDVSESAEDILAVYTGAMTSDHEESAIMEAFGTEKAGYAKEVVSITSDPAENSFTVKVLAAEKEKAEKGLAYVAGKIAEAEKTAQGIGTNTLRPLTEGVSMTVIPELMDKQHKLVNTIAEDEDSITRAKRVLTNVQESKPYDPGDPVVRWAVTGAVLGLVLMLAIYLTSFLRKKDNGNLI